MRTRRPRDASRAPTARPPIPVPITMSSKSAMPRAQLTGDRLGRVGYRDDLEAAQRRIAELEDRVGELQGTKRPPMANPPPSELAPRLPTTSWSGKTILGIPVAVVFLAGSCAVAQPLCGRACGAMTDETAPAMTALRACAKARAALGDDVGWGAYGCANCEGGSGGDPLNGGCHSSSDWQMPVSGSRGHGSYTWSSSALPGKPSTFTGGRVVVSGGDSISISPNGCD